MKKGIFIGITGLDLIYYMDEVPENNRKGKTDDYRSVIGGPAANAAITYTMLGGKARLITHIGCSPIGMMLKKMLSDYDIEVIDLCHTDDLPSISGIGVNKKNGDRTIWSGQNFNPMPFEEDSFFNDGLFCLTDCNLSYVTERALEVCSLPIVLDAGSMKPKMFRYFELADDIIASTHCVSIEALVAKFNNKNLAVTNGGESLYYVCSPIDTGYGIQAFDPPKVQAVDTLGAGDVFHGAYCFFKYVRKESFEDALHRASEVAACSVTKYGVHDGVMHYLKNK